MGENGVGPHAWPEVVHELAELARDMLSEAGVDAALARVCARAAEMIDGCAGAGVLLARQDDGVRTVTATSRLVSAVHGLHDSLRDGPWQHTLWRHTTVQVDDLADDARWPRFAAGAVEVGARGLLAYRLFTRGSTLGGFTLVSEEPGVLDDEACELGEMFASHAAIALAGVQEEGHLENAIRTRQVIGQAVGLLAHEHHITTVEAFDTLSAISQKTNVKLRDLAQRVVDDHDALATSHAGR